MLQGSRPFISQLRAPLRRSMVGASTTRWLALTPGTAKTRGGRLLPGPCCQRLYVIRRMLSELGSLKFGIEPGRCQQFVVCTAFTNLACVDDQDLVGLSNGGQPVRNH